MMRELAKAIWRLLRIVRWARGDQSEPMPQLVDEDRRRLLGLIAMAPAVGLIAQIDGAERPPVVRELQSSELMFTSDGWRSVPAYGPRVFAGDGSPHGEVTAPRGSMWINQKDGRLFINVDGRKGWNDMVKS